MMASKAGAWRRAAGGERRAGLLVARVRCALDPLILSTNRTAGGPNGAGTRVRSPRVIRTGRGA
jgi:hypothetical protein